LLLAQKAVFETSFYGGISVAAADIDGNGSDEIVVGAGPSGGPRVRVLKFNSLNLPEQKLETLADFFAYNSDFRGGVNVAAGDVDGDGFEDIIAGTGIGGGPRVRVISGADIATLKTAHTGNTGTIADFFAYDSNFRGGVFVAAGNHNGDKYADVAVGPGYGGGPHIRVFDGDLIRTQKAAFTGGVSITDFLAFSPSTTVVDGDNPFFGGIGGLAFTRQSANGGNQQQLLVASNRGREVSVTVYDHNAAFQVIPPGVNLIQGYAGLFLPGGGQAIEPDVTKLRDAVSVGGAYTDIAITPGNDVCADDANDF
jgi:hypothetical protein